METTQKQSAIQPSHIQKAMDYTSYRLLIDNLLQESKVTGPNQSEDLANYTKMNVQRMNRWDKTAEITPELKEAISAVQKEWIWLIITEGWCGDAAQNIPTIVKMASLNPKIEVKLILRDENLEVMDAYLTNGSRSIPILVCLEKDTLSELGIWGPRPAILQEKILEARKKPDFDFKEVAENAHKWYAQDKTIHLQEEFVQLIRQWNDKA